jgi:hypothetical protein
MERGLGGGHIIRSVIPSAWRLDVKKLAIVLLFAAACRSKPAMPPTPAAGSPAVSGASTGAPTARAAVEAFLGAVRSGDLQAVGGIWGTVDGAARDLMRREELEQRTFLMVCYLKHDDFRIVSELPSAPGQRKMVVELRRGTSLRRSTTVNAITARNGRWYVLEVDLDAVRDFCQQK